VVITSVSGDPGFECCDEDHLPVLTDIFVMLLVASFPKVCSYDLHPVCMSVYYPPLSTLLMFEPFFMKLGMYIMVTEPISTAYFINPSYRC
jgi:hypothetical protein